MRNLNDNDFGENGEKNYVANENGTILTFDDLAKDKRVMKYLKEAEEFEELSEAEKLYLLKGKQAAMEVLKNEKLPMHLPLDDDSIIKDLDFENKRIVEKGEGNFEGLYLCNLSLVIQILEKYMRRKNFDGGSYDKYLKSINSIVKLIEAGNLGLRRGLAKYNYQSGYKLQTYLTWWIRQSLSSTMKIETHEMNVERDKSFLKRERIREIENKAIKRLREMGKSSS